MNKKDFIDVWNSITDKIKEIIIKGDLSIYATNYILSDSGYTVTLLRGNKYVAYVPFKMIKRIRGVSEW